MAVALTITLSSTVIFLSIFSAIAKFETFTRTYHSFNETLESVGSELVLQNGAQISQDALQITPDYFSIPAFDLRNKSGRIMFRQPFRLWDGDSVASFNTSFLVNMFPINGTHGEGLAFLIAPNYTIPDNSYGEYLGLTNQTLDDHSKNDVVAIELDTVKQSFDIDDNHIGLNIHSVNSTVAEPLTPLNITLATSDPTFHIVWISYDGTEKIIRVYIANKPTRNSPTPPIPKTPIIQDELDLKKTVRNESYIGFSASTGTLMQLNSVLEWNFTVDIIETKSKSPSHFPRILLAVGIPLVLGLMSLACYLGYRMYKKWLVDRAQSNILNRLRTLPGMPKEFGFRELKKATCHGVNLLTHVRH